MVDVTILIFAEIVGVRKVFRGRGCRFLKQAFIHVVLIGV